MADCWSLWELERNLYHPPPLQMAHQEVRSLNTVTCGLLKERWSIFLSVPLVRPFLGWVGILRVGSRETCGRNSTHILPPHPFWARNPLQKNVWILKIHICSRTSLHFYLEGGEGVRWWRASFFPIHLTTFSWIASQGASLRGFVWPCWCSVDCLGGCNGGTPLLVKYNVVDIIYNIIWDIQYTIQYGIYYIPSGWRLYTCLYFMVLFPCHSIFDFFSFYYSIKQETDWD